MSLRLTAIALLAAPLLSALSACQAPPPRITSAGAGGGPVDAAAAAQCRQQAEDVYNAQNRSARLQTDSRDMPFSGTYNPNVTTRGLSDRYAMDAMIGDCMRNAANRQAGPDLGTAPAQAQQAGQARVVSRLPSGPAGGPPAGATVAPAGVPLERAPPPPAPARP